MKKYRLKVKSDVDKFEYLPEPINSMQLLCGSQDVYLGFTHVTTSSNRLFTVDEILSLDPIYAKYFDILPVDEVDKKLYYIILPYITEGTRYINLDRYTNDVMINTKVEVSSYVTKFTMDEIEELFPELKQFATEVG